MESVNELCWWRLQIFPWYAFCNYLNIVCDARHTKFAGKLLMNLAAINLINTNRATGFFIIYLGFLDETIDNVLYIAVLGDEYFELLLFGSDKKFGSGNDNLPLSKDLRSAISPL